MAEPSEQDALNQYEQRAFARYFVHDIHFPLVAMTLLSLVSAWLMWGTVPPVAIVLWLLAGALCNLLRELFVRHIKPRLESEQKHALVLHVFAASSLLTGTVWGAFTWLYFDQARIVTQLVVGSYIGGLIGGSVTPLAIYLPAFYWFVLPTLLPYVWLMAQVGGTEHLILAALSVVYLVVMSTYAHATNRLHRETMRLRFEKQTLIDDLELRKADAENALRHKGLFLAGVSHDLKQPLRAITLYTSYLRHSELQAIGEPQVKRTVEKIESAAGAIHAQISRLLELSRLQSGAMPVHLVPVDLAEVLAGLRELLGPDVQARGVQLRLLTGRSRQVMADRRMLESILLNLLSNAIKHADGGQVYVGTRRRDSYPPGQQLCIEVRDNGAGIPAHRLPLLFDAYRSFDDRQASDSHGLGLAIAKAQASYLGCEIDVRSQPGRGSTFTLCGLRTTPPLAAQA
jgi:signal transduction histidine kinase